MRRYVFIRSRLSSAGSERPLAAAENGNCLALAGDGVDVETLVADHEVDMDHGLVYAKLAALVNYFGYAAATFVYPRQQFGIDEWEEMVYTELAAGRPVLYIGSSPTMGGHAFVCDGYDGNGLFHVCMGAQGLYDGYYSLSVLNPFTSTNPYEGSKHLGFTRQQDMIIGLDPSLKELKSPLSEKPELWQYMKMTAFSGNIVRFYFQYIHDAAGTVTADYALGTIDADGKLNPCFIGDPNDSIVFKTIDLGIDVNWKIVEIDSAAFQAGETLRLHPMLRFRHTPEAEWQLIPPDTIYVDAGRSEDGKFFITNVPYQMEYVSAAITSGLGRIGGSNDLTVTIRNNEQTDYIGDISLIPYYYGQIDEADVTADTPFIQGKEQVNGAYLRAGQEDEVTFMFTPQQGGLVRFDLCTGNKEYFDSFTMEFDPTAIKGVDDVKSATDGSIYDLQGRKVITNPSPLAHPLKKGIYIRKGKKYIK